MSVHGSHCCRWHGCKYGDENCPVANGKEKQLYLCEYCYEDLEHEEYHQQALKNIAEIKKFKRKEKVILHENRRRIKEIS